MDTVRPGFDRPEDRPMTLGRPANRQQIRPLAARPPHNPNQPPVGRTSRSEPERRRTGWIWALGLGLGVPVILGAAGAAYLAFAPPNDMIRDQMIAQVKAKTGRTLTIAGPLSLTVGSGFGLSIRVREATLSAAPNMGGEPLVSMTEMTGNVRLWPLLMRRVSVDSLVVRQPVFDLRVDATGKRSWDFADIVPQELVQYAQATPGKATATDGLPDAVKDFVNNASDPDNPSPQMKAKLAKFEELTLGDVRIEDGTVHYRDARNGAHLVASSIDTHVRLASLASPLDASGKLDYQGQPVAFSLKLASPKAIIEDRPAKLAFSLSGAPVEAKYEGTITARATIDLEGDVSAKAGSLRALAAWLGHELPPADGYGPMAAAGKLKVSGTNYGLNLTSLGLDGATASGTLSVDASAARPRVTANLRISELDLNKYSLAAGKAIPAAGKPLPVRPAGGPKAKDGTGGSGAASIEDLINGAAAAGGPKVKGYTKRAGWSTDPIALDGLGLADLDAKLAVEKLLYRDIKVGQSTVTVALKGRVLRANFDDVQLYEGRGRGFISIDANAQPPVVGGNMSVDGVAAAYILKDVADFELLAGTGRMSVAIGAQGTSEAELVQTANGKADFAFTNGAIVGYNIPGTVRGLTQGKFSGFERVSGEKTEFNELAASFTIANGVATNQDLRLNGPALRVTGAGQIQLPAQAVDYTVKPKITAALLGQTGSVAEALGGGIEVPVRITGPWAKPHFAADSAAALKDPKNIEAAKEIGRKLKDNEQVKKIGNAIKGLWSKGGESSDPNAPKPNAKQMIENLLKKNDPAPAPQN